MPLRQIVFAPGYSPVDAGCDLWDNCFLCPLDASLCGSVVNMKNEQVKTATILLFNRGKSPVEISKELKISKRQVYRYLNEAKNNSVT